MVGKHILDKDIVIIREQTYFDNGAIMVIADEKWRVTLKEVELKENEIILKPANDRYQPYSIELGTCQARGKMVGLIRN